MAWKNLKQRSLADSVRVAHVIKKWDERNARIDFER